MRDACNRDCSPRYQHHVQRSVLWTALVVLVSMLGCGCTRTAGETTLEPGEAAEAAAPTASCPVFIRQPSGPPTIPTGTVDERGNPVTVSCATCHATKPANLDAQLGKALTQFHQSIQGKHGNLTCTSCHNQADGFASLRLADGKSVPYPEVMTLCAQCHGTQFRDYQHGAHGGMTGYWDLHKGGRVRNNCIDCHQPHAPQYPTVTPAKGPHDRFQTGGGHE